jgi:hypothetical protein
VNKKYQIFVSSTYDDLKNERDEVIKACLRDGNIPVGMEMFNAADEEQWEIIKRTIDLCDYYCVVVARRYGSRGPSGTSFTEMEFDYAVLQKIPVFRFILHDDAVWEGSKTDKKSADLKSLEAFRSKLKGKMTSFWHNKDQLAGQVSLAISQAINLHPRPGWIRAEDQSYEAALAEIARLSSEGARLRQELEEARAQSRRDDEIEHLATSIREVPVIIPAVKQRSDSSVAQLVTIRTDLLSFFWITAREFGVAATLGALVMQVNRELVARHVSNPGWFGEEALLEPIKELAARSVLRAEKRDRGAAYHLTGRGSQLFEFLSRSGYEPEPSLILDQK